MGKKNHLILDKNSGIALRCGEPGSAITVKDARAIKKLNDLAQQRRAIGLEVSKLLKDHGLALADDDEETIICT